MSTPVVERVYQHPVSKDLINVYLEKGYNRFHVFHMRESGAIIHQFSLCWSDVEEYRFARSIINNYVGNFVLIIDKDFW